MTVDQLVEILSNIPGDAEIQTCFISENPLEANTVQDVLLIEQSTCNTNGGIEEYIPRVVIRYK